MSLHKFRCIGFDNFAYVVSDWPLFYWIFMSMEFLIQQMKWHVTFGNSVMTLHCTETFVAIFLPSKNEMQFKFRYWRILHRKKCMTGSQILLTYNSQYFQGVFLLNSCIFCSFRDGKTRKMVLTSLWMLHNVTSVTSNFPLTSGHWLPVWILEAAISLARWKVNLRLPSTGCRQIQTTQWNSLDLILMRLTKTGLSGYARYTH